MDRTWVQKASKGVSSEQRFMMGYERERMGKFENGIEVTFTI